MTADQRQTFLVTVTVVAAVWIGVSVSPMLAKRTKHASAPAEMKGIEIAVKSYRTEYLALPSTEEDIAAHDKEFDTATPQGLALLEVMLDQNPDRNPRHIRFWEPPEVRANGSGYSSGHSLKDPWGLRGYRIILDYDGDGIITNPSPKAAKSGEPAEIPSDVILYTAGADGDFDTWDDNVCSWK